MSEKKHIYLMPGLAASPKIFENLTFSEDCEIHYLNWILPTSINETLDEYVKRLSKNIIHQNSILIGVSFGGIIVQELKKYVKPKNTVIISSIKSLHELPTRLKFVKKTKTYKLFPAKAFKNIEVFSLELFGDKISKRINLYKKYLSVRDELYLKWAVYNVLHWENSCVDKEVIHIHGTKDGVFPPKNIPNFIPIENGTHIMILNKAKSISKILSTLL